MVVLLVFTVYGCATPALWKATNPNEYVAVSANDISEADLNSNSIAYHKDENSGVYYIEKDNLAKLKDYTIRVFATPITVAVDAGLSIIVVGVLGVIWIMNDEVDKEMKEKQKKRDQCAFDPDCPYDENGLYRY